MSIKSRWNENETKIRTRREWYWKSHPELREKAVVHRWNYYFFLMIALVSLLMAQLGSIVYNHPEDYPKSRVGGWEPTVLILCMIVMLLLAAREYLFGRDAVKRLRTLRAAAGVA